MLAQWVIDQLIHELAYYKWENAGRPDEMALSFWLEAEKEILSSLNNEK